MRIEIKEHQDGTFLVTRGEDVLHPNQLEWCPPRSGGRHPQFMYSETLEAAEKLISDWVEKKRGKEVVATHVVTLEENTALGPSASLIDPEKEKLARKVQEAQGLIGEGL